MVHQIRRWRKFSRVMVVLLSGVWLGCCSCGILPTRQYRQDSWKSSGWKVQTDSLLRSMQVDAGLCREVVLERIRYLPPDSLGVQHRQEILQVRISEDGKARHRVREEKIRTVEEQDLVTGQIKTDKRRVRWLFYACGLLLIAGICRLIRM